MTTTLANPAPDDDGRMIDLRQAQSLIPHVNGQPVNYATIYSWAKRGAYGTKLATSRVGRTVVTTPKAVREFLAHCRASSGTP